MLTIFSYKQPVNGNALRIGIVTSVRDTKKHPVDRSKYRNYYRYCDLKFRRSRYLLTVHTLFEGPKFFYDGNRMNWRISIPFVGPILQCFGLFKKK